MSSTIGRPTKYSPELIDIICDRLATTTRGLNNICKDNDVPSAATVWRWLYTIPDFRERYARARVFQSELMNDEIDEIMTAPLTENGEPDGKPLSAGMAMAIIQQRKLIIETIKWRLSKLQAPVYGDNRNMNVDVKVSRTLSPEEYLQLRQDLMQKQVAQPTEDIEHEEM